MNMKVTVLGRWGAYPAAGEATAGYLLETDRHKILVDCGSGVLSNLFKRIQQEDLDALFLSHYHHDHSADLGCLQYAGKIAMGFKRRLAPLPIYGNSHSPRYNELSYRDYTVGKEIQSGITIDLKGMKVSFFQTVHEEVNLAMRFEYGGKVFVYTGDLGPATQIAHFCSAADLLLCEASLFEHEEGLFPGHMTSKQAAALAEQAGVKSLLLTHFPHIGDIRKLKTEAEKYFQGQVWLAETNQQYEL
ncbi:MAG: Ribonuclease BN [Candidatus Dichloromethanomonas elyunquensis]|nr:MAG: Ribonuclease BN [Candidatus Dichloromethanomonas elyunquensis]